MPATVSIVEASTEQQVAAVKVHKQPQDKPEPPAHIKLITDGPYGVYQLAAPEGQQEANLDIVFFHGLQLDTEANKDAWWTTWQTRDKTCVWPQTWLPDDLSSKYGMKARVLSVCYKANAIKDNNSAETIMPTLARGLFQRLVHHNVDVGGSSSGAQRRIVLVGHSLGGLVIKQLVVEAATDTAIGTYGDAAKNFITALSGIAFYATPHHGSQHDVIKRTFMGSQPQASHWVTHYLPIFSNHTQYLNTRFDEASGASTLVVPTASAKLDGSFQYEVAADHDDVCRPPSRVDVIYVHFTSYVKLVAELKVTRIEIASLVRVPDWERPVADGLRQTGAVCIYGMGGSGKSTLSKVMYNQFRNDIRYNGRVCFLEMGKTPDNAKLQLKLLNTLTKGLDRETLLAMTDGQRRAEISEAVQTSGHFFLVIDDVWQHADLENLLSDSMRTFGGSDEDSCFGASKSWLLVTTRNKKEVQGALIERDNVVWLEQPTPDEKLQRTMLCKWASVSADGLSTDHLNLVGKLLKHCHGLPLHLRLLGSLLKTDKSANAWRAQLYELEALGVLHKEKDHTHRYTVLRASLENLEPHLLLLFLGFAVFFPSDTGLQLKQSDKRPSWLAWCRAAIQQYDKLTSDDEAYALICKHVDQLVDRALLTWSGKDDDPVTVHDALRDYAVEYVQFEHSKSSSAGPNAPSSNTIKGYIAKDPSDKWSRSCPAMQLLRLEDCSYSQVHVGQACELRAVWITRCYKLNTLKLDGLSALRALWIVGCPKLSQLPSSLSNCTTLTELHVRGCSSITMPDFITNLTALKRLTFERSACLCSLPEGIGQLTSLQVLSLSRCVGLRELLPYIGEMHSLTTLDLSYCKQLTSIPTSITRLAALKELKLRGCRRLKPEAINEVFQLRSLHKLDLDRCGQFKSLPASINNLTELQELILSNVLELWSLTDELCQLRALQKLDLRGCMTLESLPTPVGSLAALHEINLDGCSSLKSLPDDLSQLQSLTRLHLKYCKKLESLPASIGGITALQELWLTGCSNLSDWPAELWQLQSLRKLDLQGFSRLKQLPASIDRLAAFQHPELSLSGCSSLTSLPEGLCNLQSMRMLDLSDCSQLKSLPISIGSLTALQGLDLGYCSNLESLPEDLSRLSSLRRLSLKYCSQLTSLPASISNLTALRELSLSNLSNLSSLPDALFQLPELLKLDIRHWSKSLPASISNLTTLLQLDLSHCSSLKSLPDGLSQLQRLRRLDLEGCSQLEELPTSSGQLTALVNLCLEGCSSLKSLPDELSNLQSLKVLWLKRCSQLKQLPDSISNLKALQTLNLSGCDSLTSESLPNGLFQLQALTCLDFSFCRQLKSLPASICNLAALEQLNLQGCSNLESLPGELSQLSSLRELNLSDCSQLKSLPTSIGNLTALQQLWLTNCSQLTSLPASMGSLTALRDLHHNGCSSLDSLPAALLQLQSMGRLEINVDPYPYDSDENYESWCYPGNHGPHHDDSDDDQLIWQVPILEHPCLKCFMPDPR